MLPWQPTTQVLLDDGTGTFPYDITDRVLQDPGYTFDRGREDEGSAVSAGVLNLTLNNSDGRFTPGSTILGTPSPVVVDQQIRVKETVAGTTYTRYTGYVKAWPVAWPAVVSTYSTASITAADAQARAERRPLTSVLQEEVLADSPVAYYTLGEPAGAVSAADCSGNQAPALTMTGTGADVVFGNATGPGTDGLTAAEFAAGKYLTGTSASEPVGAFRVEAWFATSSGTSVITMLDSVSFFTAVLAVNGTGKLSGTLNGASSNITIVSGAVVTDGLTHHGVFVFDGVETITLYLDGVEVATSTLASAPGAALTRLSIGGDPTGIAAAFVGTVAHVAAGSSTLSAARVTAHYQAGATGALAGCRAVVHEAQARIVGQDARLRDLRNVASHRLDLVHRQQRTIRRLRALLAAARK